VVKRFGTPEEGELVIAKIYETSKIAAWCELIEYPNLKGLIHITEAIGKWIYDINEVVKVGQTVVAKVIGLDEKNKIVNLSLKRVSEEDVKEKWNEYRKEETAEKVLEMAAKKINKSLDEAYEEVGYILQKKFGYLFNAFEEILKKESIIDKLNISEEWKDCLIEALKERFGRKEVEIKYELKVYSLEGDGINRVKEVLKNINFENLTLTYLSSPRYLLKIKSKNPKEDEKKLLQVLEKAKKFAENKKVIFEFKKI